MSAEHGSHHHRGHLGVAAVLAAAGLTLGVGGLRAEQPAPPRPAAAQAGPYATATSPTATPPGPEVEPWVLDSPVLDRSVPTHLAIPAIGVSSDLLSLGLNPDRTVEVPPHERDSKAGWYRKSSTPGELGPAILLGHVHSAAYGPGVFFDLGALQQGDTVSVTRADHSVAVFRVDAVADYPKTGFPTRTVYGDTDHAALRLITCGGDFDAATGGYQDNIVAYASLVSAHPL